MTRTDKFWLKTLLAQDWINVLILAYSGTYALVLVFLMVIGVITMGTMAMAAFLGGAVLVCTITFFNNVRATHIKNVKDIETRAAFHDAMIVFLNARKHKLSKKDRKRLGWDKE